MVGRGWGIKRPQLPLDTLLFSMLTWWIGWVVSLAPEN